MYICIHKYTFIHVYLYISTYICLYILCIYVYFLNYIKSHLFRCLKCNKDVCLTHRNQEVNIFMYMCIHTLIYTYIYEGTYTTYKIFIYEQDNYIFLNQKKPLLISHGGCMTVFLLKFTKTIVLRLITYMLKQNTIFFRDFQ